MIQGMVNKNRRPLRWHGTRLLLLLLFIGGMVYSINKGTSELPVYILGAERMMDGQEIYRTDDLKPFTYPPFFAVPFVPLALLPEMLQRAAWYLVNVTALVLIIRMLSRCVMPMLGEGKRRLFWWLVALLAGRHVLAVFENQSHDLLVFLAVMASVYAAVRPRESLAGFWAGAGAACKATPGLFLPVFVWQRRFRAAVFVMLAGIVLTLLPDLAFPRDDGRLWSVSWFQTFVQGVKPGETAQVEGTWNAWNKLNQNLSGTIYRLTTPVERVGDYMFDVSVVQLSDKARSLVTAAGQGLVFLILLLATRPGLSRGLDAGALGIRRLGEAGAVVCAMVLLSPMSSKSHFCVLLIPAAFCVAHLMYHRRDTLLVILLGVVFVFGSLTAKDLLGTQLGNEILARGSVTLCAICMLLAVTRVLLIANNGMTLSTTNQHE